jgi:hypothetical protein
MPRLVELYPPHELEGSQRGAWRLGVRSELRRSYGLGGWGRQGEHGKVG